MDSRQALEFWVVVSGAIVAAIGWVIKTYTTFAKVKNVDARFAECTHNVDKRFEAIQTRLVKMIDELKTEVREQAQKDMAMGKELHKRIDKVLETSHALTMTIGELKGAMNANQPRQNDK